MSSSSHLSHILRFGKGLFSVLFLAAFFVAGGVMLPLAIAPAVFDTVTILPKIEDPGSKPYIYLAKANYAPGEKFTIKLNDASGKYGFKSLAYTCAPGIQLGYVSGEAVTAIPCGEAFATPDSKEPTLSIASKNTSGAYLQIDVILENRSRDKDTAASAIVYVGNDRGESVLLDDVTLKSI